jgi:hypothetical protein
MPDGRWADVGVDEVVSISAHIHPHSNGALIAAALENGTTKIGRLPKRDSRGRISIPGAEFLAGIESRGFGPHGPGSFSTSAVLIECLHCVDQMLSELIRRQFLSSFR